ncbi:MAG: GldG family protein [Bacteroidales bacterium]|jgi:gliding-associated putative ABC transporter substrate-binding component GldG|nr:GldG family protein [Bacteroidales bacterium]
MKTKKQLTYSLLIILGALILVNVISVNFFKRFDNTQNKDYTMSKATKNILKNLNEPVTITAYFTKDLPPQYSKVRKDFQNVLSEYSTISKGMVRYQFIDPNTPELQQEAAQNGIYPVMINVRAKDKIEQQRAYIGAVIKAGTGVETIPIVQSESAIEYNLTMAIKKLTIVEKPFIGIIQGHGEPNMQSLNNALGEISYLYNIEPLYLSDSINLIKYKTLVINAPKSEYSLDEIAKLEEYLSYGGKLLLNLEHNTADLQSNMQITANHTGLEAWLSNYGLIIEDNVVIDKHCGNIGVQQQQGPFNMTIPMSFPYMPIISNFGDHPITEKLQGLIFLFPASIQYTGTNMEYTPLLLTSNASGTQTLPAYVNLQKKWTNSDYPLSGIAIGGVLSGSFNNGPSTSIIVIADGDYMLSQGQQRVNADNINLFANSIDWLSDDTGLIDLRSKGLSYRPIDDMEDSKKAFLKWLNFLLPIAIIICFGLINMQIRRSKRVKRMEENYVK